jgi:ribonuclease HI
MDGAFMAKVRIICDGSLNNELQLGGYSGGIQITSKENEWTDMYHGTYTDCPSSHHCEMRAIAMGFKHLRAISKVQDFTIESIEVFTDSQNAMQQFSLFENGKQHNNGFTFELAEMSKQLSLVAPQNPVRFEHVKAHVKVSSATPLQMLHHIIDRNALSTRLVAQKHLLTPDISKTKYYGILLTPDVAPERQQELRELGYYYASQGKIARVSFPGGDKKFKNNPFYDGIKQFASLMGKDPQSFYQIKRRDKTGAVNASCKGLDRSLVRHHLVQAKRSRKNIDFSQTQYMNAGVAARLMHGDQYPKEFNESHLTGRLQPASKFVINMFLETPARKNPGTINEWLDRFDKLVDVPVINGMNEALKYADIPNGLPVNDPYAKILSGLNEAIDIADDLDDPDQAVMMLVDNMSRHGYQLDDATLASITGGFESILNNRDDLFKSVRKDLLGFVDKIECEKFNNIIEPPIAPSLQDRKILSLQR